MLRGLSCPVRSGGPDGLINDATATQSSCPLCPLCPCCCCCWRKVRITSASDVRTLIGAMPVSSAQSAAHGRHRNQGRVKGRSWREHNGFDRWLDSNRLADAPGLTRQRGRRPPTVLGPWGLRRHPREQHQAKKSPPTNSAMTSLRLACFVAVVLASPEKPKRMPPIHPKSGCNHHVIARQINHDYEIHIRSHVPQSSAEIH